MDEEMDHRRDPSEWGEPVATMDACGREELVEQFGYDDGEVDELVKVFAQLCWRNELAVQPQPCVEATPAVAEHWAMPEVSTSESALMRLGWHQDVVLDEATMLCQTEFRWWRVGWCAGLAVHPLATGSVKQLHLCTNHRFGGSITLDLVCEPGQVLFCTGCVSACLEYRPWIILTDRQRSVLDRFVNAMDDHTYLVVSLKEFLACEQLDAYADEPLIETVPDE